MRSVASHYGNVSRDDEEEADKKSRQAITTSHLKFGMELSVVFELQARSREGDMKSTGREGRLVCFVFKYQCEGRKISSQGNRTGEVALDIKPSDRTRVDL
jgi:hypothetical protein